MRYFTVPSSASTILSMMAASLLLSSSSGLNFPSFHTSCLTSRMRWRRIASSTFWALRSALARALASPSAISFLI